MNPFIRYWLPVIVYCSIIFVQSSFPSPGTLPSFPFSDKLMHVMAYALLGALICRALNATKRWRNRWIALALIGAAASTAYGMSDEWHQSFVPGRSAEFSDIMADAVGSVLGCWLGVRLLYMRLKSSTISIH